jgi:hypothetical protein
MGHVILDLVAFFGILVAFFGRLVEVRRKLSNHPSDWRDFLAKRLFPLQ